MLPLRPTVLLVALLISLLASAARGGSQKQPTRRDWYGNPLPAGAVARFGRPNPEPIGGQRLAAVSPDHRLVATTAGPGAVRLTDLRTGRQLHSLPIPNRNAHALAFSPDGQVLACGTWEVVLWDTATGRRLRHFCEERQPVHALAFSPDGKILASYRPLTGVQFWEAATGKELRTFGPARRDIDALTFSPDGRLLAATDSGWAIRLWDTAAGKELACARPVKEVRHLAFQSGGKMLASAGEGAVGLWAVPTLRELPAPDSGHPGRVTRETMQMLSTDRGGRRLAAFDSSSGAIVVWDAAAKKVLHRITEVDAAKRAGSLGALSLGADGKALAAVGPDGVLWRWELPQGRPAVRVVGPNRPIRFLAYSADGKTLTAVEDRGLARAWDVASGRELRRFQPEGQPLDLSADAAVLAAAPGDDPGSSFHVYDLAAGRELPLRGLTGPVRPVALSSDHRTLAFSGPDSSLRLWDLAAGKQTRRLAPPDGPADSGHAATAPAGPGAVVLSPDGALLAAVSGDRFHLWRVETGSRVSSVRPYAGPWGGWPMRAFSTDGRTLVLAGPDGITCWEVITGKLRCRMLVGPRPDVTALAVCPGGRLLAVGTINYDLLLWDLATRTQVRAYRDLPRVVRSLAFSSDGRRLASAGDEVCVLTWDVPEVGGRKDGGPLPCKRLKALAADLFGDDAVRAYRALWVLAGASDQAVPLLRQRLRPAGPDGQVRIGRLVQDLDDDRFAVREAASRALRALGPLAEPALRRAIARRPSLELRRRAERLLHGLDRRPLPAEYVRAVRALEVLEHAGGNEARELLEQMAQGASDDLLTREAAAALHRLRIVPKP